MLTLPFFNGERTPNLPNAKATIFGLDSTNMSAANLLRSAAEGATYGLRLGIEALREHGLRVDQIRLTGGGSNSPAWCQMVADICQAPVALLTPDEGAAFGAALQALALVTEHDIVEISQQHLNIDEDSVCEPSSTSVTKYNDLYNRYEAAVETVSGFYG